MELMSPLSHTHVPVVGCAEEQGGAAYIFIALVTSHHPQRAPLQLQTAHVQIDQPLGCC